MVSVVFDISYGFYQNNRFVIMPLQNTVLTWNERDLIWIDRMGIIGWQGYSQNLFQLILFYIFIYKIWRSNQPPISSSTSIRTFMTQIAKFMGPTWGPPGSCRPPMGPILAPWTLLSVETLFLVCYRCHQEINSHNSEYYIATTPPVSHCGLNHWHRYKIIQVLSMPWFTHKYILHLDYRNS